MKNEAIRESVAHFVGTAVRIDGLEESADIFSLGLVTSLFALQLVEWVEAQFGIVVESEDLEIENFCSVAAVSAFVEGKLDRFEAGSRVAALS